jgi:hypothetical protein
MQPKVERQQDSAIAAGGGSGGGTRHQRHARCTRVSRGAPAKLNSTCSTGAAAGSAGSSSKKKSFEVLAEEPPKGMGLVAVANLKPLIWMIRWWV